MFDVCCLLFGCLFCVVCCLSCVYVLSVVCCFVFDL